MMSALVCQSALFLMLTLKALSVPLPESSNSQISLYRDTFQDNYCNVVPKDVGAFKFFCIQDHVSSIIIQYAHIFAEEDPYHFNNTNATAVCKEYADIKTYQYMLYRFLDSQATANVSNTTILSIVYMLQQARESLQEIQYDNHQIYCPDNGDMHTRAANLTYRIEPLFKTLYVNANDWLQTGKYPALFNSSQHIQYRNGSEPRCQHFMSPYMNLIMSL